jgi:endonuclease-8
MPEGDTITKLARFLDAELAGRMVLRIELHPAFGQSLGAAEVGSVRPHGKHLYLALGDGRVLRSHLGLYGSWHRYRPREPWRRPRRQASIRIRTADWDYVCFNAKEVEWLSQGGFRLADQQARLGSDLIEDRVEPARLAQRARCLLEPGTALVDVLLDQRVAAGIGNVYKSEVLFLERVSPLARLGQLSDVALAGLYQQAAALLGENLGGGPRTTRKALDRRGVLWVYGRSGQPCLRCGSAPIRRVVIGAQPRSTYWCERCQPAELGPARAPAGP